MNRKAEQRKEMFWSLGLGRGYTMQQKRTFRRRERRRLRVFEKPCPKCGYVLGCYCAEMEGQINA